MTETVRHRAPWAENPEWIWNRGTNRALKKQATLLATVQGSSIDLDRALSSFAHSLAPTEDGFWVIGGAAVRVNRTSPVRAEVGIISGGEDALESIADAARIVYELLVEPHLELSVEWAELPLQHRS